MPDEQTTASSEQKAPPSEACREISQSMTAVRERFGGQRPTDVETEMRGDKVRCVLHNAPPVAENLSQYRRAAMSAVSRVTQRKVIALMNNQDGSDIATEVFLLDVPARRDADMPSIRR